MADYDPYRIRFYNARNVGIIVGCTIFVSPMIVEGLVPVWRGPHKGQNEFQDRTVIVTGATGNVGRSIALAYAQRKFRVIMACRDMERCKILRRELVLSSRNNAITCKHLDLEDVNSINEFANDIIRNEPYVNVLINNAAIKDSKEKQLTKYGIERMYFVNFLAPYLLTFKLLGKLEKTADYAGESRIINALPKPKRDWKVALSDINFDKRKYSSKVAYKQSKLALAYFTILLERHCRDKKNNVYVYGASPCYESIRQYNLGSLNILESILELKRLYHSISSMQASGNATKCGIDRDMASREYSGRLYTYCLTHWGWGTADKDEDQAKRVWNHAYKLLLDLPSTSKEVDSSNTELSVDLNPKRGEKQVQQSDDESSANKSGRISDNKV